jgi:RNA polymerase-binding transcription factor DksA
MGSPKDKADDERDAAAAAWTRKAHNEDYRCELCGRLIEYADREAYFGSKRCSDCANYASRNE